MIYLLLLIKDNKSMIISSPAFAEGETIPMEYTCEGENINPPLEFIDVPDEAESLVLMVEDPDAPANPWVHWLVFNIRPQTRKVEAGSAANGGIEGKANGGMPGYEGPCPPTGEHHYQFKLYALDQMLDLSEQADREDVLKAMEGHVVAQSTLTGLYQLKGGKNAG